jgi:hypothetical protein
MGTQVVSNQVTILEVIRLPFGPSLSCHRNAK